jgi:hypothetical protein
MSVEGRRELIEAMRETNDAPVVTTQQLAEELGVSRRTALRRLKAAREDGAVGRLKPSPKTAVWWPTQTSFSDYEREAEPADDVERESDDDSDVWDRERIAEELRQIDVPGAGKVRERRREGVVEAVEHVRVVGVEEDAGTLRQEALTTTDDDWHGFESEKKMWTRFMGGALRQVLDDTDVPLGSAGGTWHWMGEEESNEIEADDKDESSRMWNRAELRELADNLDVPGSGEIETTRRREIAMTMHRIKVRGEIEAAKLRESWDDNLGYDSARSAWKKCVLPALQAARDQHGVPVEADQSGTWRWTG